MAETAGEKTLAPTEKRLKDAAKDGDVLRSKELSIAAATLTGAAILRAGGPWLFSVLERTMRSGLVWDRAGIDAFDPGRVMLGLMALLLPAVAAVGLAMVAVSIGAQLGPSGRGRFNPGNLAPKPQRLNPASGLSRIFGPQGWIEVGKGLLKVGLLGGIAWGWASSRLDG
ncbi:MAG TPA: EscU/YscU/HrcU family type III secretion system export apparatus switch protein, partial [Novosphingobium sp.]|nr:EscU/YscU/HrcU family type III secretion system export apparatus switch protein [Novosphingobium sp.]